LCLIFETHYARDYTLKKLTTEAYIRDPRFEALVLAIKPFKGYGTTAIEGPESIKDWIKAQDWANIVVVMHNAQFDAAILSMRYGAIPKAIICTMSMARGHFGPTGPNFAGVSLEALAKHYKLEPKTVPYHKFIGYRWSGMSLNLKDELAAGCRHDVDLTEAIAKNLLQVFPEAELPIVDMTVRMFTEPKFVGNSAGFKHIAATEWGRKNDALDELLVTEKQLQSAQQFTALLEECGEEVPFKPGKNGLIPAIAKTDAYMQELSERGGRAGDLARARLDVKSTLEETRAYQLAEASERGALPILLKYCGAATGRWSGGELNPQNLPRKVGLRGCFQAPEGTRLLIADFAQIELRILCALAGDKDKLDALRNGRDLYRIFATGLYGGSEADITKEQRLVSKIAVLGLGYGLGKDRFWRICQSYKLDAERWRTDDAVDLYRTAYSPKVANLWQTLDKQFLPHLARGDLSLELPPIVVERDTVILPNGLRFPFYLYWSSQQQRWIRKTRYGESYYWGGAFTEFLCQSLARVCLSDIMLKVKYELKLNPVLLVHDELVYIVPSEGAEEYLSWILRWMAETPHWWKDGPPMAAEGRIAEVYGK
jgi:DNA polymerase family A